MRARWGTCALVLALSASSARAECNGRPAARWALHQGLVLLLNPMGAEHQARVGLCVPLYATRELALAGNHVEAGVTGYVSPIHAYHGGYVELAPASFLFVRAELFGAGVWSLPLAGAGYVPREGGGGTWRMEDLPVPDAPAGGFGARLFAVLRGRLEVARGLSIVGAAALAVDFTELGHASHWVDIRHDVLAARADTVLVNDVLVALGAALPGGPELRFGAYSALVAVPASGYVGHQAGAALSLGWTAPDPALASIELFVRLGLHSTHAFRTGEATTMGGVAIDWDLGGL